VRRRRSPVAAVAALPSLLLHDAAGPKPCPGPLVIS